MSGFIENPTLLGLMSGGVVLLVKFIWDRVSGSDEKSIPAQLAEINTRLAGIETTLRLMQLEASHAQEDHDELKKDFWDHLEKYHGGK